MVKLILIAIVLILGVSAIYLAEDLTHKSNQGYYLLKLNCASPSMIEANGGDKYFSPAKINLYNELGIPTYVQCGGN